MSDESISQFDWRLINQQRQINDCVFRLFDSSKYLTTLRSNIFPCQNATTLIWIPFYSIFSVTAWPFLRSKNCLSFFSRKHFQKVLKPSVILFACFLTENIICICHYFRWMSWPFLRASASRLVDSTLSSFFAWCRAKVCRSSSKDICTL